MPCDNLPKNIEKPPVDQPQVDREMKKQKLLAKSSSGFLEN
ncbi:8420_t:CDS:1, partial [Racocetra persica]